MSDECQAGSRRGRAHIGARGLGAGVSFERKKLRHDEWRLRIFFPKDPPARSTVVVARMPGETPIEISVVAVRDLKDKKVVRDPSVQSPVSNAVQVGNRLYVSGVLGMDANRTVPKEPRQQVNELLRQMREVLRKAGMEIRNMAYIHVYVDSGIPVKLLGRLLTEVLPSEAALSVIEAAALPMGAHIEISGVASKDARREGVCNSIGDTIYCPGAGGTIEQVLKRISESMTNARTDIGHVVITNVFIDDIQNFEAMNKVYAGAFGRSAPARVTLQSTSKADELTLRRAPTLLHPSATARACRSPQSRSAECSRNAGKTHAIVSLNEGHNFWPGRPVRPGVVSRL